MAIDFDLEEIMRCWADEHPAEMAYISTLMYIYDQERAIYRIQMECIDRHGQKHGIVEEVDRSDLIGKTDPFAYILGIINKMYEELQKNVSKEKEKKEMEEKLNASTAMTTLEFVGGVITGWVNDQEVKMSVRVSMISYDWYEVSMCKTSADGNRQRCIEWTFSGRSLASSLCPADYIRMNLGQMREKLENALELEENLDELLDGNCCAPDEKAAVRTAIAHIIKGETDMPVKFEEEIKSVTFTPIDNDHMLKMAKAAVVAWYNEHNAPATIGMEDVYITWFCKVLQNWKALAGTHHSDGMYYEVTYDGDKDFLYVDAYKKWQNVSMSGEDIRDNVRRW